MTATPTAIPYSPPMYWHLIAKATKSKEKIKARSIYHPE
jgi:hypothetical protein